MKMKDFMKTKFFTVAIVTIALAFGFALSGCGDTETWDLGEPPRLTRVTIAGVRATLGTPSTKPASASPGSVTLKSKKIEAGVPTLTVDNPTIATLPASVAVQLAVTPDLTPPAASAYSAAKPASLSNRAYLWVQATENKVSNYYVIRITVEYSPVEVFAIKSHPASRAFTLADWTSNNTPLTVTMEEESEGYEYQWYSHTSFSNAEGTAVSSGGTTASYTPDITAVGDYYYYATVTFSYTIAGNTTTKTVTSNPAWIRIAETVEAAPTEFSIGDTRLNYVRGVGGTGSFMFRQGGNADASPDADVNYIDLFFGDLGANVIRIMVQDDYLNYIQNTVQSRNSNVFFHDAQKNFFAVIRRINEYGGYVFANPWTAPPSLKTPEKIDGGNLRLDKYVAYANHFRDFLTWLNDNDAPIFALGILNEPDYGAGSAYEGMGLTPTESRDWFMTVGHFTTQRVTNEEGAGVDTSIFADDIIPGYGGGGPTHHVLTMSGDVAGHIKRYMDPQIWQSGIDGPAAGSNNNIELMARHYYGNESRYTMVTGPIATPWADRPQANYDGPYEAQSLAMSPQMYAPGSTPGNIKREIWQTEHDFNSGSSTSPPSSNVQRYWNYVFSMMNDIDWCLRVAGESVFDWWYSSSWSGMVTSWHPNTGGYQPYTITPRGRAFAHYGRYVNETWLLPMNRTRGTVDFNVTDFNGSFDRPNGYNAGSTDPKISAFEDVNGKFISIVMYTPTYSAVSATGGSIPGDFGRGGSTANNNPTSGSTNVGRIAVVLPDGFVASGATALRSYGGDNADGQTWDNVPTGTPRYWIDEPAFLSPDGKSVEVTLPGGNIISIKVMGSWTSGGRHFEERPRPHDRYINGQISGPVMKEGMTPPVR
jgi:hypothetical protein